MKKVSTKLSKQKALIISLIALLIIGGGYAVARSRNTTPEPPLNEIVQDNVNATPPSEEEVASGDKTKENIPTGEENNPSSDNLKSVNPVITSAGQFDQQIEVRTLVPGVYESTGKCKATFTQRTRQITREVEGIKDATTTRCDTVAILRSDFPGAGSWDVVVSYTSPTAQGTSSKVTFEVK